MADSSITNMGSYRTLFPFFLIIAVVLLLVWRLIVSPGLSTPTKKCPEGTSSYWAQPGDNCWEMSRKNGWTLDKFKEINPTVVCDPLMPGTSVCLPPPKKQIRRLLWIWSYMDTYVSHRMFSASNIDIEYRHFSLLYRTSLQILYYHSFSLNYTSSLRLSRMDVCVKRWVRLSIFIESMIIYFWWCLILLSSCLVHLRHEVESRVQNYWYARTLVGIFATSPPALYLWCTSFEFCFSLLRKKAFDIEEWTNLRAVLSKDDFILALKPTCLGLNWTACSARLTRYCGCAVND